jgi:2-polyprenyl-3-methyl-5-hydroxy-6-metoxy-1,4-benzoquinol methylase
MADRASPFRLVWRSAFNIEFVIVGRVRVSTGRVEWVSTRTRPEDLETRPTTISHGASLMPPSASEQNASYYGELAAGRGDYWRKMAAPRHRVATFLRLLMGIRPASAVDMGCGNGWLLLEIEKSLGTPRFCGIDLSKAQMEANARAQPGIVWRVCDLSQLVSWPAEMAGRFDAVIASEIIEHVEEPETLLANARTLAASPSGVLLLSTQSGPVRETERRVGHQRHFTREEMRLLLTKTGWEPVRVWNTGFPFHDLSKWLANLTPTASIRRFGERPYGRLENLVCAGLRAAFLLNSGGRGAQLFALARLRP